MKKLHDFIANNALKSESLITCMIHYLVNIFVSNQEYKIDLYLSITHLVILNHSQPRVVKLETP